MVLKDRINIEESRQFESDDSIIDIDKNDITIVIPVLNEEEGIGKVIEKVKEEGYHKILVIDGYSTDQTVSIASMNGAKVISQHGIGKTGAIKTSIEHVKTPYFIVMDGDCTYDPKDIGKFLYHIMKYDEIIGVRTVGRENIPLLNRLGNWIISSTFNLLFGTNIVDVCSGMYALRTNFARNLTLETSGFDVEVEVAAQVVREGKITQIPINYSKRVGQQKLQPLRHGIQIFSTIWRMARLYNPVFLFSALTALNIIPAIIILLWVLLEWTRGVWHNAFALFGILLIIIGLLGLTISTMSMLLKRMEQRIINKLKLY